MQCAAPWTTRHYCAVFHFDRGSERVNTLGDTDVVCVATLLILFFLSKKSHHCTEERYKRRPQKNTPNVATVLRLGQPDNYKFLFLLDGSSFDKLLKTAAASKIA